MTYNAIEDLPEKVRHVLPIHAQEIYKSSFNHAHEEYKDQKKRRDPKEDLEVLCHKVAWNAVKKRYYKNTENNWVEKER